MKTLYVLRHAHAVKSDGADTDHGRPLSPHGLADAHKLGIWLAGQGITFDHLISSDSMRTKETVQQLLKGMGANIHSIWTRNLYLAGSQTYLYHINQFSDEVESGLIVGHNNGISDFVTQLTKKWTAMNTCELAQIKIATTWSDVAMGNGELLNLIQL